MTADRGNPLLQSIEARINKERYKILFVSIKGVFVGVMSEQFQSNMKFQKGPSRGRRLFLADIRKDGKT